MTQFQRKFITGVPVGTQVSLMSSNLKKTSQSIVELNWFCLYKYLLILETKSRVDPTFLIMRRRPMRFFVDFNSKLYRKLNFMINQSPIP